MMNNPTHHVLIVAGLLMAAVSCTNPTTSDEYELLVKEVEHLRLKVADLENSPEFRLQQALNFKRNGQAAQAVNSLELLMSKYPASVLTPIARKEMYHIKAKQLQKEKSIIRAIRNRFAKLEEQEKMNAGTSTVSIRSIKTSSRWRHDKAGKKIKTEKAPRDHSYILANLLVYAEESNPVLPALALYQLEEDHLKLVEKFQYHFHSWSSYAHYLGEMPDPKNDFNKTRGIKFNTAVLVPNKILKEETLFLLATRQPCITREDDRFNNPPVKYQDRQCTLKNSLTAEEVLEGYRIFKIFNKKLI